MLGDTFRLISKAGPTKWLNAARVLTSYYVSRASGNPNHGGLPISLSIEPTTACNLRCPECPSGLRSFHRPTGKMDLELLRQILDDVKDHCAYINFYFQGEPYLHPQFLKMISMCNEAGIYSATSTNAHFLDATRAEETVRSGLDRIIISIDGTDQETYQQYRREGQLEKVLTGTKNLIEWKRRLKSATPHIIFQFLVVKPNQHQVGEVYQLAKELGVDEVRLKTAQIYAYEEGNELIPTIDRYSRYRQNSDGRWTIKNPLDNHCWRMWSGAVITWDGRVVPCCFDKDAQHSMGSLKDRRFKEIWNNAQYRRFRTSILTSRSEVEMCRNCSEGTTVFGSA